MFLSSFVTSSAHNSVPDVGIWNLGLCSPAAQRLQVGSRNLCCYKVPWEAMASLSMYRLSSEIREDSHDPDTTAGFLSRSGGSHGSRDPRAQDAEPYLPGTQPGFCTVGKSSTVISAFFF